jgi:hypothetical protein
MSDLDASPSEPSTNDRNRLGVRIYQIASSDHFRSQRQDGTGWAWSWADAKRQWMTNTPAQFAYRCLPLTIANQTGWWVYNPVSFSVYWDGNPAPGGVRFQFDAAADLWSNWVTSHFGHGIITWRTPFLFITTPAQSRLLVTGPVNYFKHAAQPLTAIIESDWMKMSFTMNWKLTAPNTVVRFEVGEPILQVIPFLRNIGADVESADVSYMQLNDDPELARQYKEWTESRLQFHKGQAAGGPPTVGRRIISRGSIRSSGRSPSPGIAPGSRRRKSVTPSGMRRRGNPDIALPTDR